MMEKSGTVSINVSAGTYAAHVNIPVGLVGRLSTPHLLEDLLDRGECDYLCLGRASIADPFYPKKLSSMHSESSRF